MQILARPPAPAAPPRQSALYRLFVHPATFAISLFLLVQLTNVFAGRFWAEALRNSILGTLALLYGRVLSDYRWIVREVRGLRELLSRGIPITVEVTAAPPITVTAPEAPSEVPH